jgi:hypothetical protein
MSQHQHMAMDDIARRYLLRTAQRQLWRLAPWYELEELISDGVLCWQVIVAKYQPTSRAHAMRLFQTSFRNHIYKLALKHSMQVQESYVEFLPELVDPDAELIMRVYQAPQPLRACLLAILARPQLLARPHRRYLDGRREPTNCWLSRITGISFYGVNVTQQLRDFAR